MKRPAIIAAIVAATAAWTVAVLAAFAPTVRRNHGKDLARRIDRQATAVERQIQHQEQQRSADGAPGRQAAVEAKGVAVGLRRAADIIREVTR